MKLSENDFKNYTAILREELIPAMGCTEPIAIAYAAHGSSWGRSRYASPSTVPVTSSRM